MRMSQCEKPHGPCEKPHRPSVSSLIEFFERKAVVRAGNDDVSTRKERERLRPIVALRGADGVLVAKQRTPTVAEMYGEHEWMIGFRQGRPIEPPPTHKTVGFDVPVPHKEQSPSTMPNLSDVMT